MVFVRQANSYESIIDQVVKYAEASHGNDPSWGSSDAQCKRLAGSALKRLLISFLPEALQGDAGSAFHFYVKDYRPK